MDDLDLNLLRVLDVLLRTEGVSRAARELGMTQSGVSRALQRLRAHFGDELLIRQGRGMVLTATAVRLRAPVARILSDTRQLFVSGRGFSPQDSTWCPTIATASYLEQWFVPALVERMRQDAPNVDLRVVGTLGNRTEDLEDGRVDLALEPAEALVGPETRRLFSDTFCCVVREGHPALAAPLTLESYVDLEHILVAPNGGRLGPVDDYLKAEGLTRRIGVQVASFASPMPLLMNSDRIVTLPVKMAEQLASVWPVVMMKLPFAFGSFTVSAFWSARNRTDPANQWLREVVYETASGLVVGE